MKLLKLILIMTMIYGCTDDDGRKYSYTYRDPFTDEQLKWIQNIQNPTYRVVTQKNGIEVAVDTIKTNTTIETHQEKSTPLSLYDIIYYYAGTYSLIFVNFYNLDNNKLIFRIDNEFKFHLSIDTTKPSTEMINGVSYSDVHKDIWQSSALNSLYKTYFKKGVGFLYLEKDSIGSGLRVNYSASLIP